MKVCSVLGCGQKHHSSSFCANHYASFKRHGDPLIRKKRQLTGTLLERLDAYTVKGDGCWSWTGAKFKSGYGAIGEGRKVRTAHRVSFELRCQEIPDGMCVLHQCDNRECTNPAHLFLGSIADNNADMKRKARNNEWGWKSTHHG